VWQGSQQQPEAKLNLYRSKMHQAHWFAHSPEIGWVMFPATRNGWAKRQAVREIEITGLFELPLRMAFNTGMPGSPCFANRLMAGMREAA
jgi:hypothetical protein